MVSGLGSLTNNTATVQQPKTDNFDINDYFKRNTISFDEIQPDDLMMLSHKTKDGYRASFVRLSDLKKFISEWEK